MTDAELIARLRENQAYEWQDPIWETRLAAADRIEALTKEREQWRRAAETRAEGWKISDDARIEAEIKLAKAMETLRQIADPISLAQGNVNAEIAIATLAEIKGERR